MDIIFNTFLTLHILGGTFALLTGLINLVRKKGDRTHKSVGKVFFISMLTAGGSAFVLATIRPNHFLFMVGVFTVYMILTGYRYLRLKSPKTGGKPTAFDWALSALMTLAGIYFIVLGVMRLLQSNFFGIVFIVFALLGGLSIIQDFKYFRGRTQLANYWLLAHIQRMIGGFIAAVTAFLVVNATHFPAQIPAFVYWLLPTVILTPLIVYWSGKYTLTKR